MKRILCLHTADVHTKTFGPLFSEAAPRAQVSHVVRPEWLDEARRDGLSDSLRFTVASFLVEQARNADAVLCTCSTLGPIADSAPAERGNIVRIDTPLMRAAVAQDGNVVIALCLASTQAPTIELLNAAFAKAGKASRYFTVVCADAWLHFERGETELFAAAIANQIKGTLAEIASPACVVLAQASMAVAEPLLRDIGIPVYSSPRLAVDETVWVANRSSGS